MASLKAFGKSFKIQCLQDKIKVTRLFAKPVYKVNNTKFVAYTSLYYLINQVRLEKLGNSLARNIL